MRTTTKTPPAPAIPVHRVEHITGRRVTCTCGWATAGNVQSADAGRMIAEDHIGRVTR